MKQESMPVEQDGMALAAKAPDTFVDGSPVLDAEDTPTVEESTPTEVSPVVEAEAISQQEPTVEETLEEETPTGEGEALAAPAPAQEKANFFSKVWSILIAKPEITLPILFILSLVGGLMIGYSVMGDGPVKDIFNPETWTHIVKLIFG